MANKPRLQISELSEEDRTLAVTRGIRRATKQFAQREHLRLEIDCITLLRELEGIEMALYHGYERRRDEVEGVTKTMVVGPERTAQLKAVADLKYKRLYLALPPLKPTMKQSKYLDLGNISTSEGRLQSLMVISHAVASGEITHEEGDSHFNRIKQIHDAVNTDLLDELVRRIETIENKAGMRTLDAESKPVPGEADTAAMLLAGPSWGNPTHRMDG